MRTSPARPESLRSQSPPDAEIAIGCTAAATASSNRALHVMAITRARIDPQTRAYLDRKQAEGKTKREALRCLKRHLARHVHRLLSMPPVNPDQSTRNQLNSAISVPCLT